MFNPETDLQLPKIMSQRQRKEVLKNQQKICKASSPTAHKVTSCSNQKYSHTYVYLEFIQILVINRRSIN